MQGGQVCAPAPKQNISFNIAGAPAKGDASAPVTIIEFSDFQCPFSAKYNMEVMPRIEEDYIRTGKVRYVFRDFPLENIHANAQRLAEAGRCAFDQKKFWGLEAILFANQATVKPDNLVSLATQAGLDAAAFSTCLAADKAKAALNSQMAEASADGVTGTPTFFLGRTAADGKLAVTRVLVGAQPYENFKQAIDALLAEAAKGKMQL